MTFVCAMDTHPVLGFCGEAEIIYPQSRAICWDEVISVRLLKQYRGTSTYRTAQRNCGFHPSPLSSYFSYRLRPAFRWKQSSAIDNTG